MTNALERQLPELTFDDVDVTIQQLADNVTAVLSEKIAAIIHGDRTISNNRILIMQLCNLCSATIGAMSKERGEKIKEETAEKLKKSTQIFEKNTNLLEATTKTITYIASATLFFSETMKDNETTLMAKRKAQVEKDKAQNKVDVCKTMLNFLKEQEVSAETMKNTIDHNRNGRKGESYHLKQLEGILAPAKTWGSLVSGGIGWLWNRGGSKPTEVSAPVEGGGSATEPTIEAVKVEPSLENIGDRPAPASPKKESFKDAVEQPSRPLIGRGRDPKTALRLRGSTS